MAVKIMLDAGHYGNRANGSPCQTTPKYYESNMNWDLHVYLKEELEKYGFQVATTRSDKSEYLTVFARGQLAEGYDLFLSIHSNAAGPKVYEGCDRPVVIYPIQGGGEQKKFAASMGQVIRSVMNTKQNYRIYTREYPNRPGIDYYGVIRGAVAAGCKMAFLLEHGFHTDTDCTKWLLDDANLKKLAQAEAEMIAEYYHADKETESCIAKYREYVPRVEKPEAGNKYYIRKADGGYSPCIKGSPVDKDCNVLSNCVGYAVGRFNEIGGYEKIKFLRSVNAENFMQYAGNCKTGMVPKLGACAVWQKGKTLSSSDGVGHVAIVENVISDTLIVTSESGYGSKTPFWLKSRNKDSGNWGAGNNSTFLGFIYNPAVTDSPQAEDESEKTEKIENGDLVSLVPNAVYWSGKAVPAWVKARSWYVRSQSIVSGNVRVVIRDEEKKFAICSPIDASQLVVVEKAEKAYVPKVNDKVAYRGAVHYARANSDKPVKCKGGNAIITRIYRPGKSKHPYHLIRVKGEGSTVYGWVDAGSFEKL